MKRITVQDYQVLVLTADEGAASANKKGHLFEEFVAQVMYQFGFDNPTRRNVNVTSEGIELDIALKNSFTNDVAFVECKAYTTNVKSQALTSFYGNLGIERMDSPDSHGYLFALPKLTADGDEKARKIEERDSRFHYFDSQTIVESLITRKLIDPFSSKIPSGILTSDPCVIVTSDGLYSCVKVLDPDTRRAVQVTVWHKDAKTRVPQTVISSLAQSDYGLDLEVVESPSVFFKPSGISQRQDVGSAPIVVTVRGSSSDFEYQFPASPKFFVGRRSIVDEIRNVLEGRHGTFVLNAQSGWGKSSLALKMKAMTEEMGGSATVIDSRTASSPDFVVEALRFAATKAAGAGVIQLPTESSWASLASSIATIENARWTSGKILAIFFDQFENIFLNEAITRQFRDLTLAVNDLNCPLVVGYAWKTDLVGWTESHPYRLRDEIRSVSVKIIVNQMGAKDVEALLRRLEKRLKQRLARDLRQRLREYSQGLPWLFKKLSEHIIREVEEHGKSQEQLVNEALNIQSLFDSDLAGLQPVEQDAIRHVARWAPVSAAEVTEKYDSGVIQSLLDRRLIVPVGEKLDTYWDIFRDFLNTGQIPIEESYSIGINPQSASKILAFVMSSSGDASFAEIAKAVNSSVGNVVNVTRTLRLLGIATYEAYGVHINEAIFTADDPESAMRRAVSRTLRRHKAYSLFVKLTERLGENVPISSYFAELPKAFPAIDAKASTWATYGRAFSLWFQYAGLGIIRDNYIQVPGEGFSGAGSLLSGEKFPGDRRSGGSGPTGMIHGSPGTPLRLLLESTNKVIQYRELGRHHQRLVSTLVMLGLAVRVDNGTIRPAEGAVVDGQLNQIALYDALKETPGGEECLRLLERNPRIDTLTLGALIRNATGASWSESTVAKAGKDFRSWTKHAGLMANRLEGGL